MPDIESPLTDFRFPPELPEARSTFRFVSDLRYIDPCGV
jgi:hypothetical protein